MSWHDSPRFRPIRSFASVSSSTVEPRGKTWGIRSRGDTTGTVKHSYRCPVHGQFDALVSRADVPDEMPCPLEADGMDLTSLAPWQRNADGSEIWVSGHGIEFRVRDGVVLCDVTSPWAGSQCGIGHAAGEVMS
jgi:hypothetical protein